MANMAALISAITGLLLAFLAIGVFAALWHRRTSVGAFLHGLAQVVRTANTLELELSEKRVRIYLKARGADEAVGQSLPSLERIRDDSAEQILELHDSYRQQLIDLTGVEGKGRSASLRKLTLFAVEQKKINPDRADDLIQFEEIAAAARVGLISPANAHAVVTVSGSLLQPTCD